MKLTNNFTLAEFNFRDLPLDDTLMFNAQMLADNLQAVRDFLGKPIEISSWYRPTTINRKAKGSKTSQHLHGEAVDFYVRSLDAAGLDDLFKLIIDGKIKLPHACSQIEWEYATEVRRNSPLIDAVTTQARLTSEQIDQMFLEASQL